MFVKMYKCLNTCCDCVDFRVIGCIQWTVLTLLQHFVLVEFMHKSDVDHILNASSYINKKEVVPVRSPFLWFRAPKKSLQQTLNSSQPPCLMEMNRNNTPTAAELRNWMQGADSVSLKSHLNCSYFRAHGRWWSFAIVRWYPGRYWGLHTSQQVFRKLDSCVCPTLFEACCVPKFYF